MVCISVLLRWQGSCGQQIQANVQRAMALKQMLVQGHNLRLLDEAGGWGTSSTRDQKTKDKQHMINQPKGSFPEKGFLDKGFPS